MSDRQLKTAKQLGITEKERNALLKVRELLAAGVMLHRADPVPGEPTHRPLFNMGESFDRWECGQVGCIGGWMAFHMGLDDACEYVGGCDGDGDRSDALHNLFYPPESKDYCSLTCRQAVNAIDKFLSGQKYPWGI